MIFVTVGGQLPFDRLVHAVDRWAEERGEDQVFAQIGASENPPRFIRWQQFLTPSDFRERARAATLLVSHAGIGSILTAIDLRKPIVVVPRRSALGEHRNDHQLATVTHLRADLGVTVAADVDELLASLERVERLPKPSESGGEERQRLLRFVREFIGS